MLIKSKNYVVKITDGGRYHDIKIWNQYWFVKTSKDEHRKNPFFNQGLILHRDNNLPAIISSLFGEQFKYEYGEDKL